MLKEETRTSLIKLAQAAGATQINFCHDALPSEPEAIPTACCTICQAFYPDESGCDPCPDCGASYFTQIFPETNS